MAVINSVCFGHNLADCRDLENKFLESWKCKILRLEHEICERVKVVTFRTISVKVFPIFCAQNRRHVCRLATITRRAPATNRGESEIHLEIT